MVQVLPLGKPSVRLAEGWARCAEANNQNEQREERSGVLPMNHKTLFDLSEFTNWEKEWVGMPEFSQQDLTPFRVINVRFKSENDVLQFAKLIGQTITPKQKALWFPFAEFRRASHLRYVDES